MNVAIVLNGSVLNVAYFEDNSDTKGFDFEQVNGEGAYGVPVEDGTAVGAGYTYADGVFTAPPMTDEEIEQQRAQKLQMNIDIKAGLISQTIRMMAPLQAAVDIGNATDEETSSLKTWQQYLVALNRIDPNTSDDIDWPEAP
ncbi:tail fiber assembly protein [Pantoea sp. GbtcB22]|uniref:tail fiber assembly protein n=1 Tax=Pantoea sp. GbtcB22 TaxID=2824767 RepID=UPI001C307546|nr:tail fiber assembly protein [Pantoea sp. GbtcB22]